MANETGELASVILTHHPTGERYYATLDGSYVCEIVGPLVHDVFGPSDVEYHGPPLDLEWANAVMSGRVCQEAFTIYQTFDAGWIDLD